MRNILSNHIQSGTLLVFALLIANATNFVFNAVIARVLSFEMFGQVTLINAFYLLLGIVFMALGLTINHHTAFVTAKSGKTDAYSFYHRLKPYIRNIALGFTILWLALIPTLTNYFHLDSQLILLAFSPILVCGTLMTYIKGYLQGSFLFAPVALIIMVEAISKLVAAFFFISIAMSAYVYLAIPLSIMIAFLVAVGIARWRSNGSLVKPTQQYAFPRRFYLASLLTGFSTTIFLTLDVVLVKHFMSPGLAGQYAFLALIGKMIFFFGSLTTIFIMPYVSRAEGLGADTRKPFAILFSLVAALSIISFLGVGLFGYITVPILFGEKAYQILPYLPFYGVGIVLYTLANTFVTYHLARKHYSFPIVAICLSLLLAVGIFMFHSSIASIVTVMVVTSIISFLLLFGMHVLKRQSHFLLSNIIDILGVFMPLPPIAKTTPQTKNILIFNWRDTKHRFAGGAEVYIHELAKRWVEKGHNVTLFSGNDGISLRNDVIDGVHIVRRGGFNFVYVWAFFYYVFRFRGRYDVIIDSQNGIPFFTPLYAKEPVFCLMHHVHQEVFLKSLPKWKAMIATYLEGRVMPWAYRQTRFITVSQSTKKDMIAWGITGSGIDIVYPGIDLATLQPGTKSKMPLVLYLGRLKAYKRVDLLLEAFAEVMQSVPKAKLVIAGSGEEIDRLKMHAERLRITKSVSFLGKVSDTEKVSLLQKAWVFVNLSYMEGWGITTIEANACGTPVVAANVPGLRDSVKNPHTGYLVSGDDPALFAERITELLNNRETRLAMSEHAIAWAHQFDWNKLSVKGLKVIT